MLLCPLSSPLTRTKVSRGQTLLCFQLPCSLLDAGRLASYLPRNDTNIPRHRELCEGAESSSASFLTSRGAPALARGGHLLLPDSHHLPTSSLSLWIPAPSFLPSLCSSSRLHSRGPLPPKDPSNRYQPFPQPLPPHPPPPGLTLPALAYHHRHPQPRPVSSPSAASHLPSSLTL